MKSKILLAIPYVGIALSFVAPASAQYDASKSLIPLLELAPIAPTDTVAPVISNVLGLSLLPTEATITWTTNELADSRLDYGTTSSYGTQATLDVSLALLHSAVLLGLTPSTTYYYCVQSRDAAGNNATDCGRTFTTVADPFPVITAPPDTIAPVITNVFGVSEVPTTATITWTTDESADSRLEYGTTSSYGSQADLGISLSLAHSVALLGLTPSTTYYFCVHSKDVAGNNASECGRSFITAANPFVVVVPPPIVSTVPPPIVSTVPPPIVSAVAISSITPTSASITWSTDSNADSQVEFGFTDAYGQFSALDVALNVNHSVVLSNLVPSTQYHFRVKSRDQAGLSVVSGDISFTTATVDTVSNPSIGLPNAIDITGPILSGITASAITASDATILLTTNELAIVQVEFGESTAYGQVTGFGASLDWIHVQWTLGLSPNTQYHYRVIASDASGNITVSSDLEFTTLTVPIVLESVPTISSVSVPSVDINSATFTWTTDVPSNSQVEYGPSSNYGVASEVNPLLSTIHHETITGLIPNTTYHFRVISQDVVGGPGASADLTFRTTPVLADQPPQAVGDLTLNNVEQTSATLSWTRPTSNSVINYYNLRYATFPLASANFNDGEGIHETTLYTNLTEPSGNRLEHTIVGLTPGTKYYFALQSVDSGAVVSPISNLAKGITLFAPIVTGAPSKGDAVEPVFTSNQGTQYLISDTTAPGPPINVRAQSLDSRIALFWTNPSDSDFLRLRIVRKIGSYPNTSADGEIIYDGDAEGFSNDKAVFIDTGLLNNKTYYYCFYAYDKVPNFSAPVRLSASPKEVRLHAEYVVIPAYLNPNPSFAPPKKLSFGDSFHEIEHVQELLATDPTLYPAGLINGYFGPLMKGAITKLQARHGLVQNGLFDTATRIKIIELSKLHQIVESPLEATTLVLARDLYRGTSGEDVRYLQRYLRDHGFHPRGLTTGVFDHQLEHAVMRFKKQHGIEPISGYAGIHVRREIHELTSS